MSSEVFEEFRDHHYEPRRLGNDYELHKLPGATASDALWAKENKIRLYRLDGLPKLEDTKEAMKLLINLIGEKVKAGSVAGHLWGLTPRGAIVHTGSELLTVNFSEVKEWR